MRVAEAHVRIDGGRDAQSLLNLGEAYLVSGDKAKAREYARRAITAAASESSVFQEYVEKEARKLGRRNDPASRGKPAVAVWVVRWRRSGA